PVDEKAVGPERFKRFAKQDVVTFWGRTRCRGTPLKMCCIAEIDFQFHRLRCSGCFTKGSDRRQVHTSYVCSIREVDKFREIAITIPLFNSDVLVLVHKVLMKLGDPDR